jgi:hypothetical protein
MASVPVHGGCQRACANWYVDFSSLAVGAAMTRCEQAGTALSMVGYSDITGVTAVAENREPAVTTR